MERECGRANSEVVLDRVASPISALSPRRDVGWCPRKTGASPVCSETDLLLPLGVKKKVLLDFVIRVAGKVLLMKKNF